MIDATFTHSPIELFAQVLALLFARQAFLLCDPFLEKDGVINFSNYLCDTAIAALPSYTRARAGASVTLTQLAINVAAHTIAVNPHHADTLLSRKDATHQTFGEFMQTLKESLFCEDAFRLYRNLLDPNTVLVKNTTSQLQSKEKQVESMVKTVWLDSVADGKSIDHVARLIHSGVEIPCSKEFVSRTIVINTSSSASATKIPTVRLSDDTSGPTEKNAAPLLSYNTSEEFRQGTDSTNSASSNSGNEYTENGMLAPSWSFSSSVGDLFVSSMAAPQASGPRAKPSK